MTLVSIRSRLTLFIVGFFVSARLVAQTPATRPDVIYKLDNTTIQAIVSEVSDTEIVYRRASNPDGPVFRMRKRDVQSIRYANGETEQYNAATKPAQPERQPEPAPRYEPQPAPRYEPQPRPQPRYEPQPRYQTERPRYERPVRPAYNGGLAFDRGHPIGNIGLMFPSEVTPLTASAEFAVGEAFGIGGRIWYWSKQGTTDITIQAIANYHLGQAFNVQNGKVDPYVGGAVGKSFFSYRGYSSGESSDIFVNLQTGVRYLVNDKLGPYAQLNLGIVNKDQTIFGLSSAVFELGLAVKFGQ